jgi:gliding motility-associated-like protein
MRKFIYIFILFFLVFGRVRASHIVGLDLNYAWVSGNTYRITLVAYGDCGAASYTAFSTLPYATPRICIFDGNTNVGSIDLAIQPPTTGTEITPVCPADLSLTQCTDVSYTIPGIKKFVYTGTYTLPYASAVWRFMFLGHMGGPTVSATGRAAAITNIAGGTITQLVDTLNNTGGINNSSPFLSVVPTPFFCLNTADNYNPGAIDPNGDSLSFFLVPGMGTASGGSASCTPTGAVTYVAPYTATAPLATSSFVFDRHTGQISFFPNALQRSLVVYNIEEFRGGVKVGTSQREMTFLVLTCTNTPPTGGIVGAANGTVDDSTHFHICANSGAFSINIRPHEPDTTNNITVTSAGLPTGATLTTTSNGTPHPFVTFSWTSTGVAPGVYVFYVTYTDNNCPLNGVQTLAYTVTIEPQPTVSASILTAATCLAKARVQIIPGGAGTPWVVKVIDAIGDTIQNFTGITGSFIDSLAPGTYTIGVYSTPYNCMAALVISIASPAIIVPTATFTNPSYCGATDGTITLHHLIASTVDTVRYYYNGVAQPFRLVTVASDSTAVLTGLAAGTYSNIIATYGNCVSTAAGPITLVNPGFVIRTIGATNPSWCGYCDGTITLYGLHPGQTDTIYYNVGGVAHAPLVATIAADSQVHFTGLCAGTYSNFYAKTAGVCISNTVGPVTLSPPPFTIRTVSQINPSWCGFCDGSITLYGLHPGQLDTIYFTKNGVAQTPIALTIPTDSMVHLTGLCAGTYTNIYAKTAGACISNFEGPIVLTPPPFTMRALTSVSPDYCGNCNGSITIYGLHPGQLDTINYTRGGVAQPAFAATVPADSQLTITGLCVGTYDNFVAHTAGSCISNTLGPVTLTTPPFTMRAITFTNPDYCGNCNGTITLFGLHPGQHDTINYTYGGVAQPPIYVTIPADSQVHLTGLCQGTYANFVAKTGGICVSNTLGPVTLTVPPFTMRAITGVNPDYCGTCNGSITLYGLHPGQLDTITYTYGGVAQPPIYVTIPADSQVHLTGLCQGTYANFVAKTGGVCVSNTLGPITLTVPPFVMRAIAFTNPDYCGDCNGTITLYGLHPGQHDTITYTYGGVAQAPIYVTIPADSQVHLSGLCQGTYANFVAKTGGICISNSLGPVTLTVPPFTMRAITFANPDYCGTCNGTITLWGLHPGQLDTITYTYGGVAQPPIYVTIPADSQVHLSGLCQGTYANFVAKTGGVCVSNTLGPVTLTVPPFVMRAVGYTNPIYCGICNGTITLYGLHPGQLDTITYTYGGVAQPPIYVTIPADSQVHLTGLCQGTYDNFVAKTGGICISNSLGPVTLTVPPFSIRSLSFTNPDYCGICNGTITIYGVYPGETDTLTYTYGGVAQPQIVRTIGIDSQIFISGLCAGLYDNFVVKTGGVCVSNSLGPANLTVPPFTMRALSYTNPAKCGFCTGTITLYGLHPGELDTITYNMNGVPQTPVSFVIPSDSSVTISGLCEGYYDNFVAKTGGVCVSNILGPVSIVWPPIIPGFNDTTKYGCKGDTVYFTNTSSPASDLSYIWHFGDGGSDVGVNPAHIYTNPGTYPVELYITNTKCYDSITHFITLNNLIHPGFFTNPDSFVCQDTLVYFTNTSTGTQLSYQWLFGDGTRDTVTNPVHAYLHSGYDTITFIVTNYVPCSDTLYKTLAVDSISTVSVTASDTTICQGAVISFKGNYAQMGSIGTSWNVGNRTFMNVNPMTYSFDSTGVYTVTFHAYFRACPDTSASRSVTIFANPAISLGPDTSLCPGSAGVLLMDAINSGNTGATWHWSTGQTTPEIIVGAPGVYFCHIAINGCEGADTVVVKNDCYLDIPNIFTPNGDGLNDYFFPRQVLSKGLTTFSMSIYNRWGNLLFQTSATDGRGWDGMYNNIPQPEGVYIYVIDVTFKDGEQEHRQGNITLIR